jgi:hypothetical protein
MARVILTAKQKSAEGIVPIEEVEKARTEGKGK